MNHEIKLTKQFDELLIILQSPRLFITNYFASLINQLDRCSASISNDLIDKIEEAEHEHLTNFPTELKFDLNFKNQMLETIANYKTIFSEQILSDNEIKKIKDWIYKSLIEIQRILLNKSILIIDKNEIGFNLNDCIERHFVICVKNESIGQKGSKYLK